MDGLTPEEGREVSGIDLRFFSATYRHSFPPSATTDGSPIYHIHKYTPWMAIGQIPVSSDLFLSFCLGYDDPEPSHMKCGGDGHGMGSWKGG